MAQLTADIIARTNKAKKELNGVIKLVDALEEQMEGVAPAAGKAGAAVNRFGKNSTQVFFQAGQAVSDFAVAGVLGAANNIEFLALQMGAGGPLLLAIAAASAAAVVFSDDIKEAFRGVSAIADETKEVIDELLTVVGGENRDLTILEKRLPRAIEEQRKLVEELEEASKQASNAVRFAILPGRDAAKALREASQAAKDELGTARGILQSMQAAFDEISKKEIGFSSALQNSELATQKAIIENQRLALEDLGLKEDALALSDKEIANLIEQGRLQEWINRKLKDRKKDEKTDLEKQEEVNRRLKLQLEALRNVDTSRLGQIITQNDRLRKQIQIVKDLNAERARNGGTLGIPGLEGAAVGGFSQEGATQSMGDLIEQIRRRRAAENRQKISSDMLRKSGGEGEKTFKEELEDQAEAMEEIINGTDRSAEAFERAGISAAHFYTRTKEGVEIMGETIAGVAGSFSMLFQEAFRASEGSARGFFVAFKAFGIAEATISAYMAANKALAEGGPILGPVMAAGILAQGLANVTRIANIQPGSMGGAGGGGGRKGAGKIGSFSHIADPRQGRTGRLQRDTSGFQSGFAQLSPLGGPMFPTEITLRAEGEDLVGVIDKNTVRINKMRGPRRDVNRGANARTRG